VREVISNIPFVFGSLSQAPSAKAPQAAGAHGLAPNLAIFWHSGQILILDSYYTWLGHTSEAQRKSGIFHGTSVIMHFSFHRFLNLRNPETFPKKLKLDHIWETQKPMSVFLETCPNL